MHHDKASRYQKRDSDLSPSVEPLSSIERGDLSVPVFAGAHDCSSSLSPVVSASSSNFTVASPNLTFCRRSYMLIGACVIPQKKKAATGGEDFVHYSPDGRLICLADGVGSWRKRGVDAGLYSKELCTRVVDGYQKRKQEILSASTPNERLSKKERDKQNEIDLKELLIEAVKETKAKGSCTFTAVYFDLEKNVLNGINFGDSGYVIIRNMDTKPKVTFKMPSGNKERFNRPD